MDWILDRLAWIVGIGVCVLCLGLVAYATIFDATHPCKAYGQPYYHAPMYVNTGGKYGGTMVPVGGGVYADCVAR